MMERALILLLVVANSDPSLFSVPSFDFLRTCVKHDMVSPIHEHSSFSCAKTEEIGEIMARNTKKIVVTGYFMIRGILKLLSQNHLYGAMTVTLFIETQEQKMW